MRASQISSLQRVTKSSTKGGTNGCHRMMVLKIRVPWRASKREHISLLRLDCAKSALFIWSDDTLNQQVVGVENRWHTDRLDPSRKSEHIKHSEHESADLRLAQRLVIIR